MEQRCILWRKPEKKIKKELKCFDFVLFKMLFLKLHLREKIPELSVKKQIATGTLGMQNCFEHSFTLVAANSTRILQRFISLFSNR